MSKITENISPTFEQALSLLDVINRAVDEYWEIDFYCTTADGLSRPYPLFSLVGPVATDPEKGQELISKTFDQMLELVNYDPQELSKWATLLYYRPDLWIERYAWDFTLPDLERYSQHARGEIIQEVLATWLRLNLSLVVYAFMAERIVTLLRGPGAQRKPDLYRPTLAEVLDSLLNDQSEMVTEFFRELAAGEMGRPQPGSVEEPELRKRVPRIYLHLWKKRQFDFSDFRQSMFVIPGAFADLSQPLDSLPPPEAYRDLPSDFTLILQNFCHLLTTLLVEKLTAGDRKAAPLLKQVAELRGVAWLLLACSYIEEKQVSRLPTLSNWRKAKSQESAVVALLATRRPANHEDETAQTLEFLSHYHPETLLLALPFATEYQDLLCQVLGWPGAYELIEIINSGKPPVAKLPEIAPAHFEAILQTFYLHQSTRRKLLDKLRHL